MTKPSGMPRSMSTITWFEPRCTLLPLHTWHLRFTSLPRPPHLLQLCGWRSVRSHLEDRERLPPALAPRQARRGVRDFLPHDEAGRHLLVHLDHAAALAHRARVDVGGALRAGAAAVLTQHALVDLQLAARAGAGKRPRAASGQVRSVRATGQPPAAVPRRCGRCTAPPASRLPSSADRGPCAGPAAGLYRRQRKATALHQRKRQPSGRVPSIASGVYPSWSRPNPRTLGGHG